MNRLILLLFLTIADYCFSQENNFIHYDTKDGLAGSTVYRICQDTQGYLWFATDNGVSKFDGRKFTNFTTEDGLTDNEVLFIRSDSKGRVWIMPFNKTICYYYQGRIYNSTNDSLLRDVRFGSNAVMAGESREGEIYFISADAVYGFREPGPFRKIANFHDLAKKYSVKAGDFIPACLTEQFPHAMVLYNHHAVFVVRDDSVYHFKNVKSDPTIRRHFLRIDEDLEMIYPRSAGLEQFHAISRINAQQSIYCTPDGAWISDNEGTVDPNPFLPGKKVSHVIADNEGNMWFATLGEGIYRLTSESMKTFVVNREVFCIESVNDTIYCGLTDGRMPAIKNLELVGEAPFEVLPGEPKSRRLYCMKKDRHGNLYKGFDSHLSRKGRSGTLISPIRPIKSIDIVDEEHIVVCTNTLTLKLRSRDLQPVDTILHERGTKVIFDGGTYYIGTLDGLVTVNIKGVVNRNTGGPAILNRRIVDMQKTAAGHFWIATNDNGVLLYRQGKVDTVINARTGLSSNICKSLFLAGNHLWVGTNKGLNKIDTRTGKVLARYGIADGLASESVNAVYYQDSVVWIGSPAGLTYFKERDIRDLSVCHLDLYGVMVSGKQIPFEKHFRLPYRDNNISFDYTAISFKSGGDITYRYRLHGLHDNWQATNVNQLTYPSLPPGDYRLELYAINKFGKTSDTAKVMFTITAPFWKKTGFWVAAGILFLGAVLFTVSRRYRVLKRRMKEKNELTRRLAELEQASLRAQMNPHFVFNCLNSLQHFILKNDFEQTNRYIARFAKLIRQTLDYTAGTRVSVTDEIRYLESYLQLEQMRFPDAFDYSIAIDPGIPANRYFIPSMLIQPFVENAIRHGIRNKQDGKGRVDISFSRDAENVVVSIEDNGVGREAAARLRSDQHIEYQSKGITLTTSRIDMINANNSGKILLRVTDLFHEDGHAAGTKAVLVFPHSTII